MKKHSSVYLSIVTLAVILGGVFTLVAQDEGGPGQQQMVCQEYSGTANTAGNAKLPDGSMRAIASGATIKFSMTTGIWPYNAGDTLQLGTGTPIKWQDVPEAPWQQGIAEAPIMITLQ